MKSRDKRRKHKKQKIRAAQRQQVPGSSLANEPVAQQTQPAAPTVARS